VSCSLLESKLAARAAGSTKQITEDMVMAKRGILGELVEGVAAMTSDRPPIQAPTSKLAVQERYNKKMRLSVSSCSLQGIAERPLPCNYNVIQFVCALSRR
jgi:hypothetical protein